MNIVFDLGAVLFTWQPVLLMQTHFPEHAPTAEAAHALARSLFAHEDWERFDSGLHGFDQVLQRVTARLGLPLSGLHGALAPELMGERLLPIEGTLDILTSLRKRRERSGDVRLYYLSNMPQSYARMLQSRHAFLEWFDGGIYSGDVNLIKPDHAIYRLLASRHELDPSETLFIDDTLVNVQAARELGWKAIHFESPAQLSRELAPLLPS
jgi:putative hydrolase of the HAD superfamily